MWHVPHEVQPEHLVNGALVYMAKVELHEKGALGYT